MNRPIVSLLSLVLAFASQAALSAQPQRNDFESEGPRPSGLLVHGRVPLDGRGYRIARTAEVSGFMGRYRVETDAGTVEAVGIDELVRSIEELPAARRLLALERSDMFSRALADGAKDAGRAVVRVLSRPADTLAALPSGLGRALSAAGRKARHIATSIGDAARRAPPAHAPAATPKDDAAAFSDFGRELAGVNKARREIARDIGIDPYTRNPLIEEKLTSLAWAAVAGGLSLDLALSAVPDVARDTLEIAGQLNALAWELPPADIRLRLEQRLQRRGQDGFASREWLRNPAFSPTEQIALVEMLEQIDARQGEHDIIELATQLPDPPHARFLIQQLRVLAEADRRTPLSGYGVAHGLVWGDRRGSGGTIVPIPVDYLSWTAPLAEALGAPGRSARKPGTIIVTGGVSAMTRRRLQGAGWRVEVRSHSPQ